MAWITDKQRTDGGTSYWRTGGAHAEGFLQMVTAAGQQWPSGWVKGRGFVHEPAPSAQQSDTRPFDEVGVGVRGADRGALARPAQEVQVDDPGADRDRSPRPRGALSSIRRWRWETFTPGPSQRSGEAGGSLIRETPGRVDSGPDNDEAGQYCQMTRARLARRRGVREEPAAESPSREPPAPTWRIWAG